MLHWFENLQKTLIYHGLSSSLVLFFSITLLLWINRAFRAKNSFNFPPSPPKLPIVGHLHRLGPLPHRSFRDLSEKYGPLMLLQMGFGPTVIVSSAEIAKQIMTTHDLIFANRPATTASKAFLYGAKDIAFANYGEYWRQMRKICVVDLLSVKRVQSFSSIRGEGVANMVNKIKQSCLMKNEVNLSELIVSYTTNVISRVALGRSLEGDWGKSKYADLPKQMMELFGIFSVEDMFPSLGWVDYLTGYAQKVKTVAKSMDHFLDEVIEDHLNSRNDDDDTRDFVDLLLKYQKDATLGIEITRECIKAVILDMYVGGTDSTNATLEWAMAEIFNHPNVMEKLKKEVHQVVGEKFKVCEDDVNKMDYLQCVIKETLRLHPPLTIIVPRIPSESTTIEGYHIPAQTRVIINAWAIGRDPKMWDKPEEFMPERFIDKPVDLVGQNFDFIPFGGGRRKCPAILFATTSIGSVLANLLYWFNWELPSDARDAKNVSMTEAFGLTSHKKHPLRLVPIPHAF
ncbi:hypothetical protein AQUCO_71400001v1 [Aquilegia coerulea]|uniref:Cytochrome P450 n=1 Tax=Aquilegia coerulea TaxID=218851 RepID=A0A2G5C0C1_AQUCA|nr:hypothetical protein AQUCO_71400001v1 [Aquilegia coerulea]